MQATARRRVVDQADAEKLLDHWEDSELDFRSFCERVGVDGRSLQCWRTNLGRRPSKKPDVQLVELTLSPAAATRAVYRVVLGAVAIEVDDDFRDETVARLLRVVARC